MLEEKQNNSTILTTSRQRGDHFKQGKNRGWKSAVWLPVGFEASYPSLSLPLQRTFLKTLASATALVRDGSRRTVEQHRKRAKDQLRPESLWSLHHTPGLLLDQPCQCRE